MKRYVVLAVSVLTAVALLAEPVYAHYFLGYSSVRSGRIKWRNTAAPAPYDSAIYHANAKWNELGRVSITVASSDTDLRWATYYNCSDARDAYYSNLWAIEDYITFNTCHLDSVSNFARQQVATHELGHALGLAHNPSSTQMLYSCPRCTSVNTPQSHDKQDYYELYP